MPHLGLITAGLFLTEGMKRGFMGLLGGSWVAINGGIKRITKITTHIRGLVTPPITTREPPSRP